jgi:hypothetical protein
VLQMCTMERCVILTRQTERSAGRVSACCRWGIFTPERRFVKPVSEFRWIAGVIRTGTSKMPIRGHTISETRRPLQKRIAFETKNSVIESAHTK